MSNKWRFFLLTILLTLPHQLAQAQRQWHLDDDEHFKRGISFDWVPMLLFFSVGAFGSTALLVYIEEHISRRLQTVSLFAIPAFVFFIAHYFNIGYLRVVGIGAIAGSIYVSAALRKD